MELKDSQVDSQGIPYSFKFDFVGGEIVGREVSPKEIVTYKENSDVLLVKRMKTFSSFGSVRVEYEVL